MAGNEEAYYKHVIQNPLQEDSGTYRFNGKWKQRGFGKIESKDIEHLDAIERNGRPYYKLKLMRSFRLRSSIVQNRLSEIGRIKPITREINLNAGRKRLWLGNLESAASEEFNESVPISMSQFTKSEI